MARRDPLSERLGKLRDGVARMDVPKDRGRSKRAGAGAADGVASRAICRGISLTTLRMAGLRLSNTGAAAQYQTKKNAETQGQCRFPHAWDETTATIRGGATPMIRQPATR